MQYLNLLSVNPCEEADVSSIDLDIQRKLLVCPDCGSLSLSIGKVKKNWYTFCRCGTYIQNCTNSEDYSD